MCDEPARRFARALPLLFALALSVVPGEGRAHFGPKPISLRGAPVPQVPGLVDGPDPIVVDQGAAIALGKALFWDMNLGSDGVACATCHFHAGADSRVMNQLAPGGKSPAVATTAFDLSPSGGVRGPNYRLARSDFPFYRTSDPLNPIAALVYASDDVVGSAGSFGGVFRSVSPSSGTDDCARQPDPIFHVGSVGVRRVEARNAPSVINSVFSFRQFWDGAASNRFNGSSQWGERDPDAGVWVRTGPTSVMKQRLALESASLASQALAPPLNSVEMSCESRKHPDLGRKLADRAPLADQNVHWSDSVLGPLAQSTPGNLRPGLATTYRALVQAAFASKYWSYAGTGPFGQPAGTDPQPYTQFEANFGMFFALAIQLYEATLISDQSPFDLSAVDPNGVPIDLSPSAQLGFDTFRTAHCNLCHTGPVFTSSALVTNATLVQQDPTVFGNETFAVSTSSNVVTRQSVTGGTGVIDTGFASNGVTPDGADLGLGGSDPFGNPLSYADQYLQFLAGNPSGVVDPHVDEVRACDLDVSIARNQPDAHPIFFTQVEGVLPQPQSTTGCFSALGAFVPTPAAARAELQSPSNTKMRSAARNSFKIPSPRNVELTGPYMHNGSMATLEEVIEFYTRGGNFDTPGKQFGTVFPQVDLRFSPQLRQALLDFLLSLTDERVRWERAPFDHPELRIADGHAGNNLAVTGTSPIGPQLGLDQTRLVPAVGAEGRTTTPLGSFDAALEEPPAAAPVPAIGAGKVLLVLLLLVITIASLRVRERRS